MNADWQQWLAESWKALSWGSIAWGVGLFLATLLGSVLVIAVLLVRLPATFFLDSHARDFWEDRHPALKWSYRIGKNLLGLVIVVVGMVLSLPGIPGQGLLTILIGIILLDFPGKRRLERAIVRRPGVRPHIDRLRARFGKPPLQLEEEPCEEESRGDAEKEGG